MILKASQREGALKLAAHLLNTQENDHVTVHEIRGFVAQTLEGALREAQALSLGTRCRQFLFSLSLNPPEDAVVPIEDFEAAIEEIERKLLLLNQPRIIVFHEKNGRRHCHVVWSRIDTEKLVAVNMAHFKRKLMDVSRALYLRHGWRMPEGFKQGEKRSPFHLTREEYQQAVRLSENPQAMKALFKAAWEQSDSLKTFTAALEERGFFLAQGDRRGFVAVDITGGIFSLTRWIDAGTRELKARLGAPEKLKTVAEAQAHIEKRMTEKVCQLVRDKKRESRDILLPLYQEIRLMAAHQRKERTALLVRQEKRRAQETRARAEKLPRGVKWVWHKASKAYQEIYKQNAAETKACLERDRREMQALVVSHLKERQELQKTVNTYKEEHKRDATRIRHEIAMYVSTATEQHQPRKIATVPIAEQMSRVEEKIVAMSDNIVVLQAALENNLISDEMRSKIRRVIKRVAEAVYLRAAEEKAVQENRREKEISAKQAQLAEYVRQYALLEEKQQEENRRREANRQFYSVVLNMGYSLNGIPRWEIKVMSPPPEKRLDEKAFTAALRQKSNRELLSTVTRSYIRPKIKPPMATVNLRASVLETKEILRRAGLRPDDKPPGMVFNEQIRMNAKTAVPKASVRFNARK